MLILSIVVFILCIVLFLYVKSEGLGYLVALFGILSLLSFCWIISIIAVIMSNIHYINELNLDEFPAALELIQGENPKRTSENDEEYYNRLAPKYNDLVKYIKSTR